MPKRESDPVTAAMAATDHELFASAMGGEDAVHDDTNDRSLEAQDDGLEGKVEDLGEETEVETTDDAEIEAKPEGEEEPKATSQKDPKTGKFVKADGESEEPAIRSEKGGLVPPGRLREATEKTKAAEAREAALKTQLDDEKRERQALNAKFDLLLRQQELARQPQAEAKKPEPVVKPDKFLDPDGYDKWVEDRIAAAVGEVKREAQEGQDTYTKRVINMNLAATHEAHGEKFEKAYQAILEDAPRNPETRIAIQRIWGSDNPGAELMKWHRNQEVLREFGNDPTAAIEKRINDAIEAKLSDPEFRKTTLAKWKGGEGGQPPRHIVRPAMKSLNGAAGTSHLADTSFEDQSEESFFERAVNPGG